MAKAKLLNDSSANGIHHARPQWQTNFGVNQIGIVAGKWIDVGGRVPGRYGADFEHGEIRLRRKLSDSLDLFPGFRIVIRNQFLFSNCERRLIPRRPHGTGIGWLTAKRSDADTEFSGAARISRHAIEL